MVLLGAGPKGAVPLSKATILGGAIGNFLSLGTAKHPRAPKPGRPLIDYEASTLMQSGELLGVVFGVLLNNLLPAICIVVFLVLILSYNSFKTLKKAIAIRKKENKAFAKEKEEAAKKEGGAASSEKVDPTPKAAELAADPAAVELTAASGEKAGKGVNEVQITASAPPSPPPSPAGDEENKGGATDYEGASDALKAIYDGDAKQFPLWAYAMLIPMTVYTVIYSLIKNVIRKSDDCQEWSFWLWYVTPVPILGGFMVWSAVVLGRKHAAKVAAGFPYLPADMQWDQGTLKRFPVTALLAGVTAGLLGIGGGMVIGPLFLAIGMEPQVGTASCAFMILFTAFSGVIIYYVDDHIGTQLMFYCIAFGFVSGQIGQRLVNAVLKKTGRPSYVVFLLGSIIGAACISMGITLVVKMAAGDYDANDVIEPDESVETHLFYLGSGFGCSAPANASAHGSA